MDVGRRSEQRSGNTAVDTRRCNSYFRVAGITSPQTELRTTVQRNVGGIGLRLQTVIHELHYIYAADGHNIIIYIQRYRALRVVHDLMRQYSILDFSHHFNV
jgi:hypothetical protein